MENSINKIGKCISMEEYVRKQINTDPNSPGFVAGELQLCDYIILDGTKEQINNWEPMQQYIADHPNYTFGFTDVSVYDIDQDKEYFTFYCRDEYGMNRFGINQGGHKGEYFVASRVNGSLNMMYGSNILGAYFIVPNTDK